MDLSKIKNLIKRNGDKIIVMENGEPELVVMSFKEYEKITDANMRPSEERRPSVERGSTQHTSANVGSTEPNSANVSVSPRNPSFSRPAPVERVELGEDVEKETEVVMPMRPSEERRPSVERGSTERTSANVGSTERSCANVTADYHQLRPLRLEDIRLEDLPL